ncbi:Hypothetical predicted protein [Olea europaea subsp. europaea]|nr:Hypothetical predicted protein [Olea europaea subsp. europaea]
MEDSKYSHHKSLKISSSRVTKLEDRKNNIPLLRKLILAAKLPRTTAATTTLITQPGFVLIGTQLRPLFGEVVRKAPVHYAMPVGLVKES